MPYVIKVNLEDTAGIVSTAAIAGGIWVPPPASGSSPGTANNPATVSSGPEGTTLTFPGLDGPPEFSAVRVSIPPGDLFRSGAVGSLPVSPAPLALLTFPGQEPPAHALTQTDFDAVVNGLLFIKLLVPDDVQNQIKGQEGGLPIWIPTSITLSSGAVTLPQSSTARTLGVNASGTVVWSTFGVSFSNTFALAMTASIGPSGDPVDRPRILAVTAGPSPSLGVSRVPGWMSKLLAPWAASAVASMLEGLMNQVISSKVSDELAHLSPPFQPSMLTPTAVVSMGSFSILPAGIDLALAIGDIFGPGIIPIAGNITTVPNVVGDAVPKAQNAMGSADLYFEGRNGGSSPRYDVPTVVQTTPPANTRVQRGTMVTCLIYYPENLR